MRAARRTRRCAAAVLLLLPVACATSRTGPPTYVGPAGPESLECARTVLGPRGWDVRPAEGSAPGLDAERREIAGGTLSAVDVILVRIREQEGRRELEAVPLSYAFGPRQPPTAERDAGREVDPPEVVSRTAALVVATCRGEAAERPTIQRRLARFP